MGRLPTHARVVVVGGGIVGCSAAYHLAKAGCGEVLLLEQNRLAGGTTWHAAGMVTRLRTSHSMAVLNDRSAKLYAALPAETGCPTGWKPVGSLLLARTPDRLTQLRRSIRLAAVFGIECHEIAVAEAAQRWPACAPTTWSERSGCRATGGWIQRRRPRRWRSAPRRAGHMYAKACGCWGCVVTGVAA